MKAQIAVALAAALLLNVAAAQTSSMTFCAGAEGASTACAQGCSGTRLNNDVTPNQGTFNEGGGNQGDGNDGFQNLGSFNIGFSNVGNCIIGSGISGSGFCDISNNAGQIVLRFCAVYPTDNKCNPGGYPPEFSQALIDQLPAIVASCNGGAEPQILITPPPLAPISLPAEPTLAPPAESPSEMAAEPTEEELIAALPKPPSSLKDLDFLGDKTGADLTTLLNLLTEHIAQEGGLPLGRKLKL